jgi:threonylcarbamoyladenosine tRNA methylthiotransferase MtaB
LNYAESGALERALLGMGLRLAAQGQAADLCIVNSCAVTQTAEKKCRNALRSAASRSRVCILTGCYAALGGAFESMLPPNVLIVSNKKDVPARAAHALAVNAACAGGDGSFYAAYSLSGRTRCFLKVQDGCDYCCSYCAVPHARGGSRSPSIASIVEQAKTIAQSGIKEVILTGINIGAYNGGGTGTLLHLLAALQKVEGIQRWRLSSIEPNLLTDEIIDFIASEPKMMPHLHIPLQSGSDRILRMMRRRYTSAFFVSKIESVLCRVPSAFIGIDIIAGFPTETDADFNYTYKLLSESRAAFLHVFPYSIRPNTPAAALPQVEQCVIRRRCAVLNELSRTLYSNFHRHWAGAVMPVLFESAQRNGMMSGYTPNYIRIETPYNSQLVNQIVPMQIPPITHTAN